MLNLIRRFRRSLRFQITVAVNTSLIVVMGVFLVVDYSREYRAHIREQIAGLGSEARVILAASHQLSGQEEFQRYIEGYCAQMGTPASPGHHIIVVDNEGRIRMRAHERGTPEMEDAMLRAGGEKTRMASAAHFDVAVGDAGHDGRQVIVGERLDNIERLVRSQLISRVTSILMACAAIVLIVNLLLNRLVVRPIDSLVSGIRAIKSGSLGQQVERQPADELQFLADEFNAMSSALQREESLRKTQMARAARIQANLLPKQHIRGKTFDIHVLFQPAEEVGGDFYDVFQLPDGRWLVALADVSGHGVPAAMVSAMLKLLLHTHAQGGSSASRIVRRIDSSLSRLLLSEDFVTLLLLVIDEKSHLLTYVNAGHERGMVLGGAGLSSRVLGTTCPCLGLDMTEDAQSEETFSIEPGDVIAVWTDGISEAENDAGAFYGRNNLTEFLKARAGRNAAELIGNVRSEMGRFVGNVPLKDDVTMLAIDFLCADGSPAQ